MASAKFLEEALSTDVDESAVNAIVGSLEDQLVTSSPAVENQQTISSVINQNHLNNNNNITTTSAISNGGNQQKQQQLHLQHGIPNGEPPPAASSQSQHIQQQILLSGDNGANTNKIHSPNVGTGHAAIGNTTAAASMANSFISHLASNIPKNDIKLLYPPGNQNNRVTFTSQQHLQNGTIGLNLNQQNVLQTSQPNKVQQNSTIVIKTSAAPGCSTVPGLVTVPMSVVTTSMVNHSVGTSMPVVSNMSGVMTLAKPVHSVSQAGSANTVGNVGGIVTTQQIQPTMVSAGNTGTGAATSMLPNVQIVNVRPGTPNNQGQKTIPPRVVLGSPHMIGARPGHSITLQSLQQLQPGQQGHLLLKTENGQYQLLRVGPAPPQAAGGQQLTTAGSTQAGTATGAQQTTYRLQTVPAVSRLNTQFTGPPLTIRKTIVQQTPTTITSLTSTTSTVNQNIITNVSAVNTGQNTPTVAVAAPVVPQTAPKQSLDNTKEKCRKFLANLLELSSREPKNVEKNVRTLIQELIDTKVEPEEFCDRLERLLNASPQPCLIGFLKKSLPLLRHSLVLKEMVIDGIKPPPSHVVFSLANTSTTQTIVGAGGNLVTTVVQPVMRQPSPAQIRLMTPTGATVVRPGVQTRMTTPTIRAQQPRMITATQIRQTSQFPTNNVIVPTSQPPALHPVSGAPPLFPSSGTPVRVGCVKTQMQQIRTQSPQISQQTQLQQINQQHQPILHQQTISQQPPIRPVVTPVRTTTPKSTVKPSVPSTFTTSTTSKASASKVEKKTFALSTVAASASSASYAPDDDINDVAAMGGVNLAEETQRILGSTEFVGTQIRSCKDELFLHSVPLQQKLRQITQKHALEDANSDVVAIVSHATQELLKNLVEKLALIAAHRIEIVKTDSRYEVTQDVRAQLKFLEELDRAERKRHDEQERELLLRAAKSRSKNEDPEQAKLKAKAKEMQRAEMEELRQREANLTALQAIGPRKKPRLDNETTTGSTQVNVGASSSGLSGRTQMPLRPRLKRANIRDLLCLLEQEKDKCKSTMLYKSYLK